MKNFSFSNTNPDDSFYCKKSTQLNNYYRNSELKAREANQRIQEIKKKYDTPSRRQRLQSLKKSQNLGQHRTPLKDDPKENISMVKERMSAGMDRYSNNHHVPTFGTNPLKESFAVNRLEKSALKKQDCKQLDSFHRSNRENMSPLGDKSMNLVEMKSHAMQEEEALFSKVRQMKQSLINNDKMKGSSNVRNSVSSFKYNNQQRVDHSAHNPNNGRPFDPRVQNIDKINSKIKQILSCLNQNQKNPSKYLRDNKGQQARVSTLSSHIFNQRDERVRNSYLNTQPERSSKIFTPFSSLPSQNNNKIQQSNVYNFYKNTQNPAFRSTYQQPSQKQQIYTHQYKPSADSKVLPQKYKQRQHREYSAGKSQNYSSHLFKRKQQISRTPACLQTKPFDQKSNINISRSRSQMDNISRSGHSENDKDLLRSGKKLGDQISRIQSKIEELENKKKKYNIQFTPFSMKNRSASVIATANHISSVQSSKMKQDSKVSESTHIPHFRSSSTTKQRHFTAHFGHKDSEQEIQKPLTYTKDTQPHLQPKPSFQLSLQQVDVDVRTVRIDKPEELNNEEASINRDSYQVPTPTLKKQVTFAFEEVRKRTDQGMQERKKKLQHHEIIKTDALKKLVNLFCEQAKFDQNLRNLKIWLQDSRDSTKFMSLSGKLSQNGVNLDERQCETKFRVEQSEHNPFFTVQGFDGSIEAVVKAYIEAQNHWQAKIMHKFDRDCLQMQGFTKNKIDLERKGFIELQDLVRLLNIESGTFYRNRDIFLIFRRLTSSDKTSFDQILAEIAA